VIGEIPQNSQKSYTTTWEDYEQALGRAEFGKLFRDIRTIYMLEKSTKNLLQEFSEKVLNSYLEKGDGIEFMEEILIPYARAADHLIHQDFYGDETWESVNGWMNHLTWLGNEEWRPAALWALKEHEGDKEFCTVFPEARASGCQHADSEGLLYSPRHKVYAAFASASAGRGASCCRF